MNESPRRYKWLDGRFVGTALKTVLSKTVIDQAVSAPIILVTFYTGMLPLLRPIPMNERSLVNVCLYACNAGMSLMEGKEDLFAECKEKFVPTFTVS